jgi:uncharacterized protein (UPF0147 family)
MLNMDVCAVTEAIEFLTKDTSLPRNIRNSLDEIKNSLNCAEDKILLRINAALQQLEDLSNDPNLSVFGRTEIWNLTSAIELLNQ